MTKIEIEGEVFGDWAFPRDRHDAYYKGVRAGLTPQQSLFLLTIARAPGPIRNSELVQRVSPGALDKLGHVIACNIRKRLAVRGVAAPFDNIYNPSGMLGVLRAERKRWVASGYRWIG